MQALSTHLRKPFIPSQMQDGQSATTSTAASAEDLTASSNTSVISPNAVEITLASSVLNQSDSSSTPPLLSPHATPIVIPNLSTELKNHPNQKFASDLPHDLRWGCRLGYTGPRVPRVTPNLKLATLHPQAVSDALAKEVSRGHTAGPFQEPPIQSLQCSPLGVVPKKDGTWRIIMDLSSPHGSSVNDFISKDTHTLHYATFDQALALVALQGQIALMAKLDITQSFRLCPVHLADLELLGIHWDGQYYIDLCLPFNLRSSPYLFNRLADAFEWIFKKNYMITDLMQYLDEYFHCGGTKLQDLHSFCMTSSCVIPARRIFLHRLIDLSTSARLPHHHISMNLEARRDIAWWLVAPGCTSRQFPVTESTLRYFAAFLADQVSYRTVKLYMASIRFFHIENNLPNPFWDAPLLHLLLQGIKCSVGLSSKRHLPITMSLLRNLKSELAQAPDILLRDKLMLWSTFTLAFFAFLRSSGFTSPSTSHFNALSHLSASDISFTSDGSISLHLKSSKTDPYRQGRSLLIAPSGRSVCAVRAIKKYMAHHPLDSDGPFYIFQSGLYLTRAQSHLHTSSSQTPTHSNRALRLPQLLHQGSYNSS